MGKVMTARDYRIRRAVNLVENGKVKETSISNCWWVKSQSTDGVAYLVSISVDEEQPGEVLDTKCLRFELQDEAYKKTGPGPDWQHQLEAMDDAVVYGYSPCNPGICQMNLCPVCKHVLAVMLVSGIVPWPRDDQPESQPLKKGGHLVYPKPLLKSLPLRERPVYRVASNARECSQAELLAAIIGGPKQIEIAQHLLTEFNGLTGLVQASTQQLTAVQGLGPAAAARIKGSLELGRQLLLETFEEQRSIRKPGDVAQLLMAEMSCLEQEHFIVLCLNIRSRIIERETLYKGNLGESRIRPCEVYRLATRCNAAAILIVHNHPSGDPTPSPEDVEVTIRLAKAGAILDIDLTDHIIIGKRRFVSLKERGLGGL